MNITRPPSMSVRRGSWRTVPNAVTVSRLLLAGPLVCGVLTHHRWTAFILIVAAGLDVLDGVFARRLGQVTSVGGQLDPIVDKILMISVVASLVAVRRVDMYFLIIFVARDVAVSTLRYAAARQGTMIVASRIAKRKTDIQIVAAFSAIYSVDAHSWGVQLLLWLAVAATVSSGADYFLRFRAAVRKTRRAESQERVLLQRCP
jgi:CDP-diacylglycerol---glycerol-3-phosphate 3-phosphatidyltransferase